MPSDTAADPPQRRSRGGSLAILTVKLGASAACFWYATRGLDFGAVAQAAARLKPSWCVFAVLAVMLQLPLIGLRWAQVADVLTRQRVPRGPLQAINAVGLFFAQVLPSVAGDSVRVYLMARRGHGWRAALMSVLIDRATGVAVLVALGVAILLLPAALTALGGHRTLGLEVFGALLGAGVLGLVLAPGLDAMLSRWRLTRGLGALAMAGRAVLLGASSGPVVIGISLLVHALSILAIWSLGQAQGLALALSDAAVLFVAMVGVAVVPVTVSGWGLRELAVVALLSGYGVSAEQALFFSVCFGLTLIAASLPGAVVWALYTPITTPPRDPCLVKTPGRP